MLNINSHTSWSSCRCLQPRRCDNYILLKMHAHQRRSTVLMSRSAACQHLDIVYPVKKVKKNLPLPYHTFSHHGLNEW